MNTQKYKHLLDLTIKSIFRRRLRSILTIIAVVIGIATIVSIFLISDGLLNYVEDTFMNMGINTIFIFPINFQGGPTQSAGRLSQDIQLTEHDLTLIQKINEIDFAVGFSFKTAKIEYKNEDNYQFVIMIDPKTADKTFKVLNIQLRDGKSLQNTEGNNIVIGPYIADELYKNPIKVGQTIKVQGIDFKVIGILEPIGNLQDDSQTYITRKSGESIFDLGDTLDQIYASVKPEYDPLIVKDLITKRLDREYGKDKFFIITATQILTMIKSILGLLQTILVSIGLISIIVASIGIMNSIYTSVIERTKEIGILKSLGARREDINFIFISESMILSLFGGLIGLGLGILIGKSIEYYVESQGAITLMVIVTWKIIILAIGISLIVGFLAGFLPSRKAAKMNIVDALRKTL